MSEQHPTTGSVRPAAPQGVAVEGFETLLSVGRRRGFLTQDDLILVLQAVELTYDVIEDVVARVRAEGIEYVEERRNGAAPVVLEEAVAEAVAEVVAEEVVEALPADLDVALEPDGAPRRRHGDEIAAQHRHAPPAELQARARRRGHGPPDAASGPRPHRLVRLPGPRRRHRPPTRSTPI